MLLLLSTAAYLRKPLTPLAQIDALGGEMGKMADRTYLQRRVLNRSKGPAVRFPLWKQRLRARQAACF